MPTTTCLNCGAELRGRFCAQCGQRVIPPYPTLREMAADAWHEFSGWDGRFVRTVRRLLHPGVLTIDVLEGRRARYVSPLRLYLLASLIYFLAAAAVPGASQPSMVYMTGDTPPIDLTGRVSDENRTRVLTMLDERAPWWANALIRPMVVDPERVIARFRQTFPRALFALVPAFAAIVALFYRRRPYSQHLVFGLHLHAVMFLILAAAQLGGLTKRPVFAGTLGAVAMVALAIYGLMAFRRVYREPWSWIAVKSVGVSAIYLVALIAAIAGTYAWAVLA
jgi:hypothetical protein